MLCSWKLMCSMVMSRTVCSNIQLHFLHMNLTANFLVDSDHFPLGVHLNKKIKRFYSWESGVAKFCLYCLCCSLHNNGEIHNFKLNDFYARALYWPVGGSLVF